MISGTVLSYTEFLDLLCTHYMLPPLNLQSYSDECGTDFKVRHALSCSKVGLIIARYNKVHEKLLYPARQDFVSELVRTEPLIHQVPTRPERGVHQVSDKDKESRGDLMIQGLWYRQADTIIDVKLGNSDADSYKHEPMMALLA